MPENTSSAMTAPLLPVLNFPPANGAGFLLLEKRF
jgi:hypothetical protein